QPTDQQDRRTRGHPVQGGEHGWLGRVENRKAERRAGLVGNELPPEVGDAQVAGYPGDQRIESPARLSRNGAHDRPMRPSISWNGSRSAGYAPVRTPPRLHYYRRPAGWGATS